MTYYELIGLSLLYIVVRQSSPACYPYFILAIIGSGVLQAGYGSLQLYGFLLPNNLNFKITGGFINPGPYGGFLACICPLALGVIFKRDYFLILPTPNNAVKGRTNLFFKKPILLLFKSLSFLCLISIIVILPATQSRAAWLAVLVSSVLLFNERYQIKDRLQVPWNSRLLKFLISCGLVLIVSLLLVGLFHFKPNSANGRLLIWKVGTTMFLDHPWIGCGLDQFKANYMKYQADYFTANTNSELEAQLAGDTNYAFNDLLQFVIENGIFGLVIVMVIIFQLYMSTNKVNNLWFTLSKAGLTAALTFSFFSYPSQILPIKIIVTVLLATVVYYSRCSSLIVNITIEKIRQRWLVVGVGMLFIVLCGIAANCIGKARRAFQQWQFAYDTYESGNYLYAVNEYRMVSSFFENNGIFLMNYGKALSLANEHELAIEVLEKARSYLNNTVIQSALGNSYKAVKKYGDAEQNYLMGWHMVPSKFYSRYLLAKLYDDIGQYRQANAIAMDLVNEEAKINSVAIQQMRSEMLEILNRYSETEVK